MQVLYPPPVVGMNVCRLTTELAHVGTYVQEKSLVGAIDYLILLAYSTKKQIVKFVRAVTLCLQQGLPLHALKHPKSI